MNQSIQNLPEGFMLGADPELFVIDFSEERFVSAHDLIPGTKAKPHPVPGGAIQVDGTAAEFNINPAKTFEEFNNNIEKVLTALEEALPPHHLLWAVPWVEWQEEYFEALPYKAKELGCMPDFDAWTGRRNRKPSLKDRPTLRTAAGHIHIGFTEGASLQDREHISRCRRLAQLMDWHVGSWSVEIDSDMTRRQLYGKAGACRYKTYGVEYRTLSNFWVMDEYLRREVWNRTAMACWEFYEAYEYEAIDIPSEPQIEQLINRINGVS